MIQSLATERKHTGFVPIHSSPSGRTVPGSSPPRQDFCVLGSVLPFAHWPSSSALFWCFHLTERCLCAFLPVGASVFSWRLAPSGRVDRGLHPAQVWSQEHGEMSSRSAGSVPGSSNFWALLYFHWLVYVPDLHVRILI